MKWNRQIQEGDTGTQQKHAIPQLHWIKLKQPQANINI